jgi:hypothetical protein
LLFIFTTTGAGNQRGNYALARPAYSPAFPARTAIDHDGTG